MPPLSRTTLHKMREDGRLETGGDGRPNLVGLFMRIRF